MISITLPSLHPEALAAALANLAATTRGPYEVLVVSPFEPWGVPSNTVFRWFREENPAGCAAAHAVAARHAQGDLVFAFADDHEMVDGWDLQALVEFDNRCPYDRTPFCLGLRGAHSGHVGTNWGVYYPYFPIMARAPARRLGWIGNDYHLGFGDSDLAMRVWASGGRCEWTDAGLIRPTPSDKRKGDEDAALYAQADLDLFVGRWWPRFGAPSMWPTPRTLRDFNLDLRPEDNLDLVEGNTIYRNYPGFLQAATRMAA